MKPSLLAVFFPHPFPKPLPKMNPSYSSQKKIETMLSPV
jgi:hypothetical protein